MEPSEKKTDRKKKKINEMKRKVANMTKEQIRAAVVKKKECNARAMQIVERMIEPNVEEVWLVENLIYINQSHFQDAVEERAIVKFCGYPLCDRVLKDIPLKQYHISTKQNKVFDITDRKNYCTNSCYRAGVYLKEQLFTSPLWLRDCEDLVEYKLLQPHSERGSSGLEIDLGNIKPCSVNIPVHHDLIKSEIISQDIDDCPKPDTEDIEKCDFGEVLYDSENQKEDENKAPCGLSMPDLGDLNDQEVKESNDNKLKDKLNNKPENSAVGNVIVEKPLSEVKNKLSDSRKSKRRATSTSPNPQPSLPISIRVEQNFTTWVTVDTLIFLLGKEKVKQMFFEFGEPLNENDFNSTLKNTYIFERYREICYKLNIMELKGTKIELPTKPLPDYDQLKKEAEKIEIKVKNFFKGDKISFAPVDENEEDEGKKETDDGKEVLPPILPLIDKHNVMKIRRQILLDRLNKTLPDIQSALSLNQFNLRKDTQEFINTLALTANNIVMKPTEWNLLCIILLRLFSLQNEYLNYAFISPTTQKRIINLLLAYNLDLTYLERQLVNMTNLEQIIKNSQ
ncbi:putative RNA polymerase II subunit B1 CTD phosphatase RPAP2 [Cimex lectularius]|uniref:RNA polymerase II subunit B1 CTD phosphatase RPAP2 homolog n=1 Tax=Cimex lectularius TaxID=79782 RepID=A0A8I6RER5_CIMLE|nr:putative RNA polymerase II subunit B1 CTD phosphatase RPAP2 [Cimex lectularius]